MIAVVALYVGFDVARPVRRYSLVVFIIRRVNHNQGRGDATIVFELNRRYLFDEVLPR